MKVFFDTSILVAAFVASHEHHATARGAVLRVVAGTDEGVVAAHSLAELYAVLTRLPVVPRIQPAEAARIVQDNVVAHFAVQTLGATDYQRLIGSAPAAGVVGGAVYDALLLAAAQKSGATRILTLNCGDFRRLAPHLREVIAAP